MQSSKKQQGEINKAFLSEQCKEIEENTRMGRTRDLFKKIRDTKGIFHVKTGTIKYRNSMDLTEAEDIKKRWQKYTEELYTGSPEESFSLLPGRKESVNWERLCS